MSVYGFSRCWERLLLLLLLGAFFGALSLEAVVAGFLWERSSVSVPFVGSGSCWILSEAVFGALLGCKPAIVIELL